MRVDNPSSIGTSTGFGIPTGGTTGQVIQKVDGTNYNTRWTSTSGLTNIVYGETSIPSTTAIGTTAVDLVSFTLPTAGTYRITYVVRGDVSSSTGVPVIFLSDNSNVLVPNGESLVSFGIIGQSVTTQISYVTITTSTTYKIRAACFTSGLLGISNDTAGRSKVVWEKIGQ
jgi:hypothetical protein